MADITIVSVDRLNSKVYAEEHILKELHTEFTIEDEKMQYHPLVKARKWDGKLRLFKLCTQTLYTGLLPKLYAMANKFEYTIDDRTNYEVSFSCDDEEYDTFLEKLSLSTQGSAIEPYGFQWEAFRTAMTKQRCVILSPTASGKSLILYLCFRFIVRKTSKPVLLIVPNKQLVHQMASDFVDYSGNDPRFNTNMISKIMGGMDKDNGKPVVISTWQSIYKMDPAWFSRFGAVMIDECHGVRGSSIKGIIEKMPECPIRIGFTGTLANKDSISDPLLIQGLLGPAIRVANAKDLMGSVLANLKMRMLVLEHPKSSRREVRGFKYADERRWIATNTQRNNFIMGLVAKLKGNTMILCELIDDHAKPLYAALKEQLPDRDVHLVIGSVSADDREEIRKEVDITDTSRDSIMVCSYGTTAVGTNIKNLDNIIFATSGKGYIRTIQSIGRGLRTSLTKNTCRCYDIMDDLRSDATYDKPNHAWNHGCARLEMYAAEQYPHDIVKVVLPADD